MRFLIAVSFLLAVFAADAADKEKFGTLPEPPPPALNYKTPATRDNAQPAAEPAIPEPEVVITTKGEDRYEEYRISGRVYMIKVTPKKGPPYYLIDHEGRGEFTRSNLDPGISPPMWVIKRF